MELQRDHNMVDRAQLVPLANHPFKQTEEVSPSAMLRQIHKEECQWVQLTTKTR